MPMRHQRRHDVIRISIAELQLINPTGRPHRKRDIVFDAVAHFMQGPASESLKAKNV